MSSTTSFQLAICAEQLWLDKPIEWRVSRLKELGFGVGCGGPTMIWTCWKTGTL